MPTVDYTNALNQYGLARSINQQAMAPQRNATGISALGRILASYFASKGMTGAEHGMQQAEQTQTNNREMDLSRALGAYRGDTPYQMGEEELFPGEAPIQGLRNEGTGSDRSAMAQALMAAKTPGLQEAGLSMLVQQPEAPDTDKRIMAYQQAKQMGLIPSNMPFVEFAKISVPSTTVNNSTVNLPADMLPNPAYNPALPIGPDNNPGVVIPESKTALAGQKAQREQEAAEMKRADAEKANRQTYDTYQVAMSELNKALKQTETGPIAGRFPAFTNKQQIAEGAGAAMAPVLKQLFRSAGEGVFTDKDQALLMEMLPKRTDGEEAVTAKTDIINSIVRSKLGIESVAPPETGGVDDFSAMSDEELQAIINGQ